LGYWRQGA